MSPGLAVCSILVAAAWHAGASGQPVRDAAARRPQAAAPSTAAMEGELYQALNQERAARNLPAVPVSPELVALARAHSADMARRDVLSHESETGQSYQQRLTEAGVASVASGENLSRSSTCLTRLIHQSLMDSPPHRENMLNPAYDSVGIGVVDRNGEKYFVTMDFIKRVVWKSRTDIRTMTLGALNDARARARLAPFVLIDAASRMADQLAEAKASGGKVPEAPLIGQRSSVFFVTSADLDGLVASVRDVEVKGFGRGGIGSAFGRSPEHPAGAYVICILLIWDGS